MNSHGRQSRLPWYASSAVSMKPSTAVQPMQKARTAMPESERLPWGKNSGAIALKRLV